MLSPSLISYFSYLETGSQDTVVERKVSSWGTTWALLYAVLLMSASQELQCTLGCFKAEAAFPFTGCILMSVHLSLSCTECCTSLKAFWMGRVMHKNNKKKKLKRNKNLHNDEHVLLRWRAQLHTLSASLGHNGNMSAACCWSNTAPVWQLYDGSSETEGKTAPWLMKNQFIKISLHLSYWPHIWRLYLLCQTLESMLLCLYREKEHI